MRRTLRLFWHNLVEWRLRDWRSKRIWVAEGLSPDRFPRSGPMSAEDFEVYLERELRADPAQASKRLRQRPVVS